MWVELKFSFFFYSFYFLCQNLIMHIYWYLKINKLTTGLRHCIANVIIIIIIYIDELNNTKNGVCIEWYQLIISQYSLTMKLYTPFWKLKCHLRERKRQKPYFLFSACSWYKINVLIETRWAFTYCDMFVYICASMPHSSFFFFFFFVNVLCTVPLYYYRFLCYMSDTWLYM